jgi:hypothetical protein
MQPWASASAATRRRSEDCLLCLAADSALCRIGQHQPTKQERDFTMNLAIWLPAMFVLGLVSLGLCFLFLKACEKI